MSKTALLFSPLHEQNQFGLLAGPSTMCVDTHKGITVLHWNTEGLFQLHIHMQTLNLSSQNHIIVGLVRIAAVNTEPVILYFSCHQEFTEI